MSPELRALTDLGFRDLHSLRQLADEFEMGPTQERAARERVGMIQVGETPSRYAPK